MNNKPPTIKQWYIFSLIMSFLFVLNSYSTDSYRRENKDEYRIIDGKIESTKCSRFLTVNIRGKDGHLYHLKTRRRCLFSGDFPIGTSIRKAFYGDYETMYVYPIEDNPILTEGEGIIKYILMVIFIPIGLTIAYAILLKFSQGKPRST